MSNVQWPILESLQFTPEQIELRRQSIGGSDSNIIMSGDEQKIMELWEFKTGKRDSDDLSDVIPVMLGHWTEDFNSQFYTKRTGDKVVRRNEFFVHPEIPYMTANLDGVCLNGDAVWEAKHVNQMANKNDVINKYLPQLHHNANVYGVDRAVLSVLKGTLDWFSVEIEIDKEYQQKLLEKEEEFWDNVLTNTPPFMFEAVEPPKLEDMREMDMTGHNLWADFSAQIIENEDAAKKFDSAKKGIKELVDDDVKRAFGHGISINRTKRGLSVKVE